LISALAAGLAILVAACWFVTGAFPLAAAPEVVNDAPGVTVDLGGAGVMHRTGVAYPAAALKQSVPGNNVIEAQFVTPPADWEQQLKALPDVTSVQAALLAGAAAVGSATAASRSASSAHPGQDRALMAAVLSTQQGKPIEELNAQWSDPSYWTAIQGQAPQIDELIREFNAEAGTASLIKSAVCASVARRSSAFSPSDASTVGLTRMRTAGFCPPLMLTRPTPGNCDILGARRVSARSSTLESGRSVEVKASVRIGVSAGLVLL